VRIRVRDLRQDDFETLWKIDQQCFVPGISYSRTELKLYMRRPGSFTMVAERSQPELAPETIGFIIAEANRKHVGHVITIDVRSEARRFGAGSMLMEAAEARLRNLHCEYVVLETAVDNAPAIAFYKKRGYFIVSTQRRYYSNGVDAFVLRKDLQPQ
jgi:ribosomal-protein-alanine N-acetyltransferase